MCACVCPIPSISQEWLDSATFCHYVIIALAFLWLSSCIFSLTKSSKKDTHRHSKNPAILSQVSLGWEYPIGLWDSDPWCSCSWLPYDLASTQSADLAQWMAEHSKGVFFFRKIRISRQLGIHLNNDTETENIMTLIDSWQVMMFVYYVQLYGKYTQI